MNQLRGFYADSLWGQVHGRRTGTADGPAVIFLHESPLSSRVFEPVLRCVDPALNAVAFDTPGYGASDSAPSAAAEIPDYAQALIAAVDALGISGFVAVGGHTGAALAIEIARQLGAGRVRGVVMTGVPLFTTAEQKQYLASWAPQVAPDAQGSQFRWAVERYQRIWGPHTTPDMLHLAAVEVLRVLPRYSWAYNACFRYDPGPALAAYDGAVLLLNAERDMFADRDQKVLDLVRHGRLTVLPGPAGQPHLHHAQRYAREVSSFALELDGGSHR